MDNASNLIRIFNAEIGECQSVCLIGGATEPLYLPVSEHRSVAEIHFREDFASSALHELAHWCLAGKKRRELEDYGYWYESVRDEKQQQKFEAVEAKPQAIEWVLSIAAGLRFRVSIDNFLIETLDVARFQRSVQATVLSILEEGVPMSVNNLAIALAKGMPHGNLTFTDPALYRGLPDK